ncbi:glycine-rich domain-containing protein [Rhodococcus sp. 2G]|uniref:glycine-rich domain-containing protein n=1 Tax=Rhodococcus sp. 2G TaxID=1570939 RepID=UPI000AA771CB
MPSSSRILVFDTPGVFQWIPGPHVYAFEPIVKAAGGGGASGMSHTTTTSRLCGPGGGGGAIAVGDRRLSALDFLRGVEITVGAGGAGGSAPAAVNGAWNPGTSGGFSAFGDVLRAEGGFGGGWALGIDQPDISFGGDGGHAILRGGKGGSFVTDPGITHSGIVRLLAAGGGVAEDPAITRPAKSAPQQTAEVPAPTISARAGEHYSAPHTPQDTAAQEHSSRALATTANSHAEEAAEAPAETLAPPAAVAETGRSLSSNTYENQRCKQCLPQPSSKPDSPTGRRRMLLGTNSILRSMVSTRSWCGCRKRSRTSPRAPSRYRSASSNLRH